MCYVHGCACVPCLGCPNSLKEMTAWYIELKGDCFHQTPLLYKHKDQLSFYVKDKVKAKINKMGHMII